MPPIFRVLEASLGDLGLSDGSRIHLEQGFQLREGDVVVLVYEYQPNAENKKFFKTLFKKPVRRTATVLEVKQFFCRSPKLEGYTASRLRLHIRKRTGGVSPLLRDDVVFERAVRNLRDQQKLAVQLLDHSESVTSKDVILQVKHWRPCTDHLGKGESVVVHKFGTLQMLYDAIIARIGSQPSDERSTPAIQVAKCILKTIDARDLRRKANNPRKNLDWVLLSDGPSPLGRKTLRTRIQQGPARRCRWIRSS